MTIPLSSADIYLDSQGLSQLRRAAGKNPANALAAVAEQFEALFLQQMLKSMRDAKLAEGLLDSDQSEFYTSLYDKQIAINLSKAKGLGLSDMIIEQLSRNSPNMKSNDSGAQVLNETAMVMRGTNSRKNEINTVNITQLEDNNRNNRVAGQRPVTVETQTNLAQSLGQTALRLSHLSTTAMSQLTLQESDKERKGVDEVLKQHVFVNKTPPNPLPVERDYTVVPVTVVAPELQGLVNNAKFKPQRYNSTSANDATGQFNSPESFVTSLWPLAQKAAQQLGVAPKVLLAQAALETGWGKAVNKDIDGRSSYNLFNIKAGRAWKGETVAVSTLEYKDGLALREKALFRLYPSFQASFDDYVTFIKQSPRYQPALAKANDAHAYARELQQAGYATDPDYSLKIINIINGKSMEKAFTQLKLSFNETISAIRGSKE
ncbi:MAG: flagellar assembly peptidoglycan hydrolase FlgJ [Gammaproteobacteria bacterium]|nr:flagellar assembly peptidoglycan hydrolase FlgJ [Gammaproteobacteria bacterium]